MYSKKQLKAIYGKWTEYLRSVDVKTFENFTRHGAGKSVSVDQSRGRRATSMDVRCNFLAYSYISKKVCPIILIHFVSFFS